MQFDSPHDPNGLRELDARAKDAVLIGDSEHDIESGRAAGVETVAVAWGPFPREKLEAARPSHWVDRPEQMLDF